MTHSEFKILDAIVSEGYKLKAQHWHPKWRKALEDAESLVIEEKPAQKLIALKLRQDMESLFPNNG
jgi:hypothetical protein